MVIDSEFTMKKPQRLLAKLEGAMVSRQKAIGIMRKYGTNVTNRMRQYPPPVSSKYVRTGRYGAGFTSDVTAAGDSVTVLIQNDVEYAQYVGGDHQVGFHAAHGWPNINDVAAEEWANTVEELRALYTGG